MPTEEQLIAGCKKGKRKAQYGLYQLYSAPMFGVAMRYARSTQEAEDILQEAFIKVFQSIKNFRGDSHFRHWLKRVVINTALNHQRNKLYLYPMVDVETMKEGREAVNLSATSMPELMELIRTLPTGCQVIFNLYAVEGYQHKEIAEMLQISEGTSKSQYARARKLLREMLSDNEQKKYGSF